MSKKNPLNIDFAELRQQKEWLTLQSMCNPEEGGYTAWWYATGLLGLIDAIQDQYVRKGWASEEEVFGNDDNR